MIWAIQAAKSIDARIHLADRDIRITLSRTWRIMRLWTKLRLPFHFVMSLGELDAIDEEAIEKMKDTSLLARIAMEDQNAIIRKTAEKRLEEIN